MEKYKFFKEKKALAINDRVAIFNVQPLKTPVSQTIHFEASVDHGLTWQALWVRSMYEGQLQQHLMLPGIYYACVQYATHVRWVCDVDHKGEFGVSCRFSAMMTPPLLGKRPMKSFAPTVPRLDPLIRSTGGREITDVTPCGTVYAYGGIYLYKTANLGASWEVIPTPFAAGNVTRLKKLSSAQLLIIGNELDGKPGLQVWKSARDERNIYKVTTLDTISDANSFWGLETHKNIVLFSPYVLQPRLANQPLRAYISRDFGDIWEPLFTAPAIEGWHFHGLKLDPYESRIWLLVGDHPEHTNVYYSDDWGKSWHSLWPKGTAPVQFNEVVALPNCLIFGLDDEKGRGFFRLNKPVNRANTRDISQQLHEAFFIDDIGARAEATGRFIVAKGVAYLPYESPRGLLTATRDGYDYYVLWDYTRQPGGFVEGLSYFGATESGTLIGYFKDENAKGSPFIWVSKAPAWVEI